MATQRPAILAFNRGLIDNRGLARLDLDRLKWSAEVQENWMPSILGSMSLRPGFGFINRGYNDQPAIHIDYIRSVQDTAIIEVTAGAIRVEVNDVVINRPAVATATVNGNFTTDLSGWDNVDETGATSAWATGSYMGLTGTGFNGAVRRQTLTVAAADAGKEHAFRIVVNTGSVQLRVGSSAGNDDYIQQTDLSPGTHSLSFYPTAGNLYIQLGSRTVYTTLVKSVQIETAGDMVLPAPWAQADLPIIEWYQSVDVMFVACKNYPQYRLERRGVGRSWSIVQFQSNDGPFQVINISTVTLAPSALVGNITLTASKPLFNAGKVGALYRITSIGQNVTNTFSGDGQFGDYIRVTGVGSQRAFNIKLYQGNPSLSATLTLQRSVSAPGAWLDVQSYGGDGSFNDGFDNQIIYYRWVIKTGNYTSGTATMQMSYSSGGLSGIARVTAVTSSTTAQAIVLTPFGAITASSTWYEGYWSPSAGYPSGVTVFNGRLWWVGKGIWGSVSDAYSSNDDTVTGDSAPINRTVGEGPVENTSWVLALQRLLLGSLSGEISGRSSQLDETITVSNFNLNTPSTVGAAPVPPKKLDDSAIMVDRSSTKLYQVSVDPATLAYIADDLMKLCPKIGRVGIKRIGIQRQPNTRVHAVLGDGTAAVLVYDKNEDVKAFIIVRTAGVIEDVVVLPSLGEDKVTYYIARTINGVTRRYRERYAQEQYCEGGTLSLLADSYLVYQGAATNVLSAPHLPGQQVVVWADGKDLSPDILDGNGNVTGQKTYTVGADGSIPLGNNAAGQPVTVQQAVFGLGYMAKFLSTKMAYAAQGGSSLNINKKINSVGLVMVTTHHRAVKVGPNFSHLLGMPVLEEGQPVADGTIWQEYDKPLQPFDGSWNSDSRIAITATAPRCATISAAVISVDTNG